MNHTSKKFSFFFWLPLLLSAFTTFSSFPAYAISDQTGYSLSGMESYELSDSESYVLSGAENPNNSVREPVREVKKLYDAAGRLTYEGEVINGNVMDGKGAYYYPNGVKYIGVFTNNILNGPGVLYFTDNSRYEGTYLNNGVSGEGFFYTSDGKKYRATVQNYQITKGPEIKVKEFKKVYRSDGVLAYEGEVVDGSVFQGQGTYYFSNGAKYVGEFDNGIMNGQGILYFNDGWRFEGSFVNLGSSGTGIAYSPDGKKYQATLEKYKLVRGQEITAPDNPTTIVKDQTQNQMNICDFSDNSIGNTSGNLENGGYAALRDGYIYYANPRDGFRLYKIKSDNTGNVRLISDPISNINVTGNWIYYVNSDDGKLYKATTGGSNKTKLTNDKVEYVIVVNGAIYYIGTDLNNNSKGIYHIDLNGGQKKLLVNESSNLYNLDYANGWLFYRTSEYNVSAKSVIVRMHRVKLDGTDHQYLAQQVSYMNVAGDWIYYCNTGTEAIYRSPSDNSIISSLESGLPKHINVSGNWIYYINRSDGNTLYRIKTDGTNKTRIGSQVPGGIDYINVVGDWIYFKSGKLKIDGSQLSVYE